MPDYEPEEENIIVTELVWKLRFLRQLCRHLYLRVKFWRSPLTGMTPISATLYLCLDCDHNCRLCGTQKSTGVAMVLDQALAFVRECYRQGVVYVDFTGGNPLLKKWLPELLTECRRLGMYSSITLSGRLIKSPHAIESMRLANLVRFSIDGDETFHNLNRGIDCYRYLAEGITITRQVLKKSKIQLIFTVFPDLINRENSELIVGNLCQEQFDSVLRFSRSLGGILINVNLLFDLPPLSENHVELLRWYGRQADVQVSLGKLSFVQEGGNNTSDPICYARGTLTFTANGLAIPCHHSEVTCLPFTGNLQELLASETRQELIRKEGTLSFCQGCSKWCYIMTSLAWHFFSRVTLLHMLSAFQGVRDPVLKFFGQFQEIRYPNFRHNNC